MRLIKCTFSSGDDVLIKGIEITWYKHLRNRVQDDRDDDTMKRKGRH